MPRPMTHCNRRGDRGFTLVEALVVVAVFAVLLIVAVRAFQGGDEMARTATIQGDSQQSARVALDIVSRSLRSLGFGIDVGGGQLALVHAGPWDVVFNANESPSPDDPTAPGEPAAMDPALPPGTLPGGLYAPAVRFAGGAETVRYTLDSDGDGQVTAADNGDDPEEATPNPRDYVLRKEVYGARNDGTNGGTGETVALVRGPDPDPDGTLPVPLFLYWIDDDDDPATPDVLHGDTDGDGVLSQAERAALGPVAPGDLALVTRCVVTVTTEDGVSGGGRDYRTRTLMSTLSFRNQIRRTGVVTGTVFTDLDSDGVHDPATESPIPNVTVRLSSGATDQTGPDGRYVLNAAPGTYTLTEFDPPGHGSTTPNAIQLTLDPGGTAVMNFGDRPSAGMARIQGTVYDDQNQDGTFQQGEPGIPGIVVMLHNGATDTTDASGAYAFDVVVGSYTVSETDGPTWGSSTPNAVDVVVSTDGEIAVVDFGDVPAAGKGVLRGIVFLDSDQNGLRDAGESGIPDVLVTTSAGDSTVTNGSGAFAFTLDPGVSDLTEWDHDGFSSTTLNHVTNLVVQADSTIAVDFGDYYDISLSFDVLTIGQTDRALTLVSADLEEDHRGDPDIIVGTAIGSSSNNLLVWHNRRKNSATPNSALFRSQPTFTRNGGEPIVAMATRDMNGDGVADLFCGHGTSTTFNTSQWITLTAKHQEGTLPPVPDATGQTNLGSSVLSLAGLTWPGSEEQVFVVGTEAGAVGRVETWIVSGPGSYQHVPSLDIAYDSRGALAPVTAVAAGDFDGDGYPDLAVGQNPGGAVGRVTIFTADSSAVGVWTESAIHDTECGVTALRAADMGEDTNLDLDLVVGTTTGTSTGAIELWLNSSGMFGVADTLGVVHRDDVVYPSGTVLALDVARMDADVYPDVVAGVRTAPYTGELIVYRAFGYLPSSGTAISSPGSGEIVTLTVDDFNLDGMADVAVGTRTGASVGEVIVFFGI